MAKLGVDVGGVQPEGVMVPLEEGNYPMFITESSVEESKNKKGNYFLKLKFVVDDSHEDAGRVVYDNVNFRNSNEVAERIGKARIARLMELCGVEGEVLEDSEEIHDVVINCHVTKKKDEHGFSNYIKNLLDDEEEVEGDEEPEDEGEEEGAEEEVEEEVEEEPEPPKKKTAKKKTAKKKTTKKAAKKAAKKTSKKAGKKKKLPWE